jgi:hypothetical protein
MVSFFESSSHLVAAGSSGSLNLARPSAVSGNATSDWNHAAQHLSFFSYGCAVLVGSLWRGPPRHGLWGGDRYVFATALHCSALGALLYIFNCSLVSGLRQHNPTLADDGTSGPSIGGVCVGALWTGLHRDPPDFVREWLSESDSRVKVGSCCRATGTGEEALMKSQTVGLAIILFLGITAGCTKRTATSQRVSVPDMITQSGCPACHVIPQVPGAVGKSGPSIEGLGERSYLARRLSNDESNLSTWLMHPHHIEPGVAMPEMGVTRMTQDSSPHFWSAATKCCQRLTRYRMPIP